MLKDPLGKKDFVRKYIQFCDLASLHNNDLLSLGNFRDLLSGVEHLRVIAATLQSRERIEEVRTKRDRDK